MNTKKHAQNPRRKVLVPFLAVTLACLMLFTTGCKKKDTVEGGQAPVVVSVLSVSPGSIEDVLRFTGDVRAIRDVRLLSQVGERIVDIRVDKGDRVREGDLLAAVENTLLTHSVAQAEAAVAAARSNLNNVESEYRRASRLVAEEAISRQQYDARKAQLEGAQSGLRQAEAVLEQTRRQYRNAYIRAPFSGIISNRFVELGDMVAPGAPVFSLVQLDTMRVMAQVSEREFTRIVPAQEARLKLASLPEQVFSGRVVKKAPILDPVSRLATVEIHFPNPDSLLVPGMFGELEIVVDRKENVPRIPLSSVQYRANPGDRGALADDAATRDPYVFIIENGKAVRRDVATGYQQGGMLEVISGVAPGDVLVVRGHHALEDGSLVKIADPSETPESGAGL
ncbi:MAG: efflux RND transporter periplasmic adaptor subunit [Smithellaceae bacterium]